MSVKAVLCKQYGPPETLVVEELPSPRAGPGEVVVSVRAASINFPDVLIIQNKYQFKPPLPFSPGSELAGVVKEVGAGVSSVRPGQRVIAFTTYGAFAEEVKTEAVRLLPLPEKMDFVTGAAFLLTYATSDHALRDRGALKAGETLLVLGAAGGVGLAAIEIGKALGARVIACASSEEKLAACRSRLLVVGFAAGEIPKLPLNLALLKGASVVGVFWGDFARREPRAFAQSIAQLVKWYAEGRLRPHVSQTLPLERAAEAIQLLASRRAKGKIVLTTAA